MACAEVTLNAAELASALHIRALLGLAGVTAKGAVVCALKELAVWQEHTLRRGTCKANRQGYQQPTRVRHLF